MKGRQLKTAAMWFSTYGFWALRCDVTLSVVTPLWFIDSRREYTVLYV